MLNHSVGPMVAEKGLAAVVVDVDAAIIVVVVVVVAVIDHWLLSTLKSGKAFDIARMVDDSLKRSEWEKNR